MVTLILIYLVTNQRISVQIFNECGQDRRWCVILTLYLVKRQLEYSLCVLDDIVVIPTSIGMSNTSSRMSFTLANRNWENNDRCTSVIHRLFKDFKRKKFDMKFRVFTRWISHPYLRFFFFLPPKVL